MTSAQFTFFRSYIREWAETLFLLNLISSRTCEDLKAWSCGPEGKMHAAELFSKGYTHNPELKLRLQLKQLREMTGTRFHHIEATRTNPARTVKRCFVGHRFVRSVERTLRWNLAQVLEPYNVRLDWSGQDPRSVQIFEDIVRRIRRADFCVFDNRATDGKPNVYIEAGIAYAFRVPFFLFEYAPENRIRRALPIPSDLSHALAFRYRNYRELFRRLYFSLPVFFRG
jgi:hypothetical protein